MSSSSLIEHTHKKQEQLQPAAGAAALLAPRRRSIAGEWLRMLLAAAVFGALYAWRGGISLLFLLSACGLLMAGGFLLQAFGPRRVNISRKISPARPAAGDTVLVEVQISFATGLPLPWILVTDYWGGYWHRELLFPGFRRSFRYVYRLEGVARGIHQLHGSRISWGDLPGLFTGERHLEGTETIKVLPRPLYPGGTLPESSCLPGDSLQQRRGRSGAEAADIRDYTPGDPLSRIHWKNSARKGTLQSRVPEREEGRMACIVLANAPANYEIPYSALNPRSRRDTEVPAFELAVSAAMGLMLRAERSGSYVQLFSGGWPEGMARHEGLGKIPGRVQDMLASITPSGTRSLSSLLEDASQNWIPGMAVTVITGLLEAEAARTLARFLVQGVSVELYYVWDQPAPAAGAAAVEALRDSAGTDAAGREYKSLAGGTIGGSLSRLGARLYCLNAPAAEGVNKEAVAHGIPRRPTLG